jgi:dTDP-4-dehydrorhamnose reductase
MAPRAVITGAAGLVGQYLLKSARRWAPGWAVVGITRAQLDLTDESAVSMALQRYGPQVIIHCAALSRTNECERDPGKARRINVDATSMLSQLSRSTRLIFLSSGEVFDGSAGWYDECADPNPINVYGRTKLEAERAVLRNPAHTVVRLVLTAGTSETGDRSFVEDMSRTAKAGKEVRLYADEFRCPLPAGVIARTLWELVKVNKPLALGDRRAVDALVPRAARPLGPRHGAESYRGAAASRSVPALRQDPTTPLLSLARISVMAYRTNAARRRPMGFSRS